MLMEVWMAVNAGGEYLCIGNPNKWLSYHVGFPHDCNYLSKEEYIMTGRKWEVVEHIRKWHNEVKKHDGKLSGDAKMEPQKVQIEWRLK